MNTIKLYGMDYHWYAPVESNFVGEVTVSYKEAVSLMATALRYGITFWVVGRFSPIIVEPGDTLINLHYVKEVVRNGATIKVMLPDRPNKPYVRRIGSVGVSSAEFAAEVIAASPRQAHSWTVEPKGINRIGNHTKLWVSVHHPLYAQLELSYDEYDCAHYWRSK